MAGRNRKKKQGCVEEPRFLNRSKEDPWVLVRRLEARLAQEKFYHEKTKTESQYELKTLQAKVKSLERQKKTYLEKLEQNPIEQQGKLEKELNETSKQLRETTQKLSGSQQIIDRLTRTNRGLKKAKERIEEHYMKEIEKKNTLITKLEEQLLEARKENKSLERLVGEILAPPTAKIADSFEDRECWELPELEIWEKISVHKDRAEREEKGQKKGDKEMTASKTLEEKTQIAEDCKLSFFPSMYEGNGKERCKGKPSPDKGVQNLPTTSKDTCNSVSIDGEQPNGSKENTSNRPNEEDGTPIQETRACPSEALPDLAKQESKLSVSNRRFKRVNKAKMDTMARYGALKGSFYPQTDDCINRLKNVCSRITVGSKTEATQNSPDANGNREVYKAVPRSPPPGFETIGAGFAVHAGMDAPKSACVESAGN